MDDDRRLGMVLLRPGWEADYDGRPPIYAVGCSGVIVHALQLDDGRYNIVLCGLDRFRVVTVNQTRLYRGATVEPVPESSLDDAARGALSDLRSALEARLGLAKLDSQDPGSARAAHLAAMSDADFVHAIAPVPGSRTCREAGAAGARFCLPARRSTRRAA